MESAIDPLEFQKIIESKAELDADLNKKVYRIKRRNELVNTFLCGDNRSGKCGTGSNDDYVESLVFLE